MASRTPSRRRAGGRSSSSQNSNQMPMILGGLGVVVLIIILVMANKGGGEEENDSDSQLTNQPAKQSKPAKTNLRMSEAVGGKTPDRPAPLLTQETLTKITELLAEAKAISNEGIKLTKSGSNPEGAAKQSEAKVKIDQLKAMIEEQSLWQEEADMGDWAQPAEYITLARIYATISRTQKTIRMNGGK